MLIGIMGNKYHGKGAVANVLRVNYGFKIFAFADPIKEMSKIMFNWKDRDLTDNKEIIDPVWGVSPRQVWQSIGDYFALHYLPDTFPYYKNTVGTHHWVKLLFDRIKTASGENICIEDVRYPHELKTIKAHGGFIIKVTRPDIINKDTHNSESHIGLLPFDIEIQNDESLDALRGKVDAAYKALLWRHENRE